MKSKDTYSDDTSVGDVVLQLLVIIDIGNGGNVVSHGWISILIILHCEEGGIWRDVFTQRRNVEGFYSRYVLVQVIYETLDG